jgi:hypothetical protein
MKMSNKEAATAALALAESFLASQNSRVWEWKCVDVKPDLSASDNKDRKISVKWSVTVEYSKDGSLLDGPGIVFVDIRKKECTFL